MAVPYTFGSATASIPLSQLDSNFATTITLGNTAIQLGNTVTTLNNMTLANVTVSSGNVTVTSVTAPTIGAASGSSLSIQSNGTTNATLDTFGNWGFGVTPSAWGASNKALQVKTAVLWNYNGLENIYLGSNYYFDGTNRRYITNGYATEYSQGSGVNAWSIAPSGTAGTAITFTQAMTLDASGNLLVGTTGITGGLSGKVFNLFDTGTVRSIVQTTGQFAVYNIGSGGTSTTPTTAGYLLTDSTANTLNLQTSTSSAIYVKANSTGGVYLSAGATSWTAVSDERKKDIIEPITDAANKVSTLRAVIGKYKTDEDGVRRSFLIAQDVQAVYPEAVDTSNLDELGLSYTDVIPLLVAAIKELKTIVDAQAVEIAALKGAA